MKIAIVILNWNGKNLLRKFLPSVLLDVDIFVADNGSTDGSVEMLKRDFPQVKIIALDQNYGFAGGYNRALAGLDHDVFVLLNSDIEIRQRDWLAPLIETLESDEKIAVVMPKVKSLRRPEYFDWAGAAGGRMSWLGYPYCRGRILKTAKDRGQYKSAEVAWASGAAFVCRAEIFKEMGGFDERFFAHQEEIDLCWRMRRAGYRIMADTRSEVYHLGGGTLGSGSSQKIFLNHRNNLWMIRKNAPLWQRILVFATRPFLDFAAMGFYAVQGKFCGVGAIFRAWMNLKR